MLPLIVVIAQLSSAQVDSIKADYQKLPPAAVEAKKVETPPPDANKIDVSAKVRSASFGHKTWLVVSPDGTQFWVEYGRSTNRPGALFGPFPVTGSAAAGAATGKPAPAKAEPAPATGDAKAPVPAAKP
jgi:hypothetical protein